MEKAGCPVKDTFFKVIYCRNKYGGSYAPGGGGISVCGNFRQRQDSVTQVIIHELIHAFDDCRAANELIHAIGLWHMLLLLNYGIVAIGTII